MSRKPIYNARSKGIDIAVWEGNTGPQFTIRKSYKDKQTGEWKESKTLFSNDLEILKELITEALSWGKNVSNIEEPSQLVAANQSVESVDFKDDDIPF